MLHDKAHGTTPLATSETLAIILGRGDHEGRSTVVMKGAQTFIVGARLFQRNEIRHYVNDLRCLLYLDCG